MATSMKMDANQLTQLLGSWSSGGGPLYRQLADSMASLIEQGALRDDVLLPPERTLAENLSVSRSTVVAAFSVLSDTGHVARRQGSGTRVVATQVPGPDRGPMRSAPLFDRGRETRALLQAVPECAIDFGAEMRAVADAYPAPPDLVESEGWGPLRAALARRYSEQGLPTTPDEILVTSGTQQACSLLLREICDPGDIILTESLTWPGLTDAAERVGARCHGVPMDDDGMVITELTSAVERLRPAVIVVNPHHHNPTGTRMTPSRRRQLADVAADYGVPVIEDRVFAELAFDRVVPPPLALHRADGPIVVVDSLSKTVWSGLRIGWIRGSVDLIGRLRLVKAIDDLGSSTPSQLLAMQLLPRLDELIERRCLDLGATARNARQVVAELLPEWTVPQRYGGASLWAELPGPVVGPFVAHAARSGVLLAGDDLFAVSKQADRFVRLPFTAPAPEFTDAVERLAEAWRTFDPAQPSYREHRTPPTIV